MRDFFLAAAGFWSADPIRPEEKKRLQDSFGDRCD